MREKEVHDRIMGMTRTEHAKERQSTQQSIVSFGPPVMDPYLIPVLHSSTPQCINAPFMVEGEPYHVTSFSLDRPYGVVVTENIDELDISQSGKSLSTHSLFPLGADIVFLEIKNKDMLKARLYKKEQGEFGFSQQGACAAFVAAKILQETHESEALVAMGDKTCRVKWDGLDGDVSSIGVMQL